MDEIMYARDVKKRAVNWLCSENGALFFVIKTEGKYAIFYCAPINYDIFNELRRSDKEKKKMFELRLDSLEEVPKTLREQGWVIKNMGNELGNFRMHRNPETGKIGVGFKDHSPILAKELTKGDVLENRAATNFVEFWGGKKIYVERVVTVVG